ncbi:YkgJ family cysteine cluster protein [Chitinimonas sp. BJYL2]|uniref:YkgJ family cysteine cluster protein n=1 Tax=Chitinimonas sp. BJYL2 TaxID=2976696 RepID=UPI0022B3D590|nr:YkgJ family cysteine cluster protein [Chitinimonas sp. BJYL2]
MSDPAQNACLSCGACCAAFRVSFDRSELDSEHGRVPASLADEENDTLCRMRGTDWLKPRCIALVGKIGESVSCGIYHERPGPCREFAPLAEHGVFPAACNRARARHGLPALPVSE